MVYSIIKYCQLFNIPNYLILKFAKIIKPRPIIDIKILGFYELNHLYYLYLETIIINNLIVCKKNIYIL